MKKTCHSWNGKWTARLLHRRPLRIILAQPIHRWNNADMVWTVQESIAISLIRIGNNCWLHCPVQQVLSHIKYFRRKSPTSSAIPITPPSHTRSTNTWFPLNFSMQIDENSELKIDSTGSYETMAASPAASEATNDPIADPSETLDKSKSEETAATASKNILKQKDYKLSAVVCEINDVNQNQKHLVALIYVGSSYHQMKLPSNGDTVNRPGQWYIFNDFSIAPVSVQEAVWFTLDWKQPCVLFYSCSDFSPADTEVALDQFVNPFVHVSRMG